MPTHPIKPKPDEDFYILWSTVTDSIITTGSKRVIAQVMVDEAVKEVRRQVENAIQRAEKRGLPIKRRDALIVQEGPGGPGYLPMDRLYEYAKLWHRGLTDEAAKLVEDWGDGNN